MSTKLKNTVLVIMTALFLFGFSFCSILMPDHSESVSERRPLAKFPTVSKESVISGRFMTDFEKYTLDQFPMRDKFREVKSATALYVLGQKDNNGLYIRDGYASKLEPKMDVASVEHAASRFKFVYDRYIADKGMNVYLSVIPDKNYFMARGSAYPSMDYNKLFSAFRDKMHFAKYIDISHLLELSDYYRTDTHWRQEKILDVAGYIASEMGIDLSAEYTASRVDTPFYGVYYGQSALPLPADEMFYLENDILDACKVYDFESGSYIPMYDLAKTQGNDPYEMFLSGPKSLLTIENQQSSTDKELIVFRDSFGSTIAPLFCEAYSKVTLVDIRYISPVMLDRFISFDGSNNTDVLFLYSTSVLNNSVTIK